MMAFFLGLLVGFVMCIPIGPINVWVIRTKLKKGMLPAFAVALGGSTMDLIYFLVILSGLSLVTFHPWLSLTLKISGVVFLLLFGLKELLSGAENFTLEGPSGEIAKKRNYFFLGVLLYISNPTIIATLSGLCAIIKSFQIFPDLFPYHVSLAVGAAIGSAAWFYFLLVLVRKYKKNMTTQLLQNMNRICGGILILTSFFMAFKLAKGTG